MFSSVLGTQEKQKRENTELVFIAQLNFAVVYMDAFRCSAPHTFPMVDTPGT